MDKIWYRGNELTVAAVLKDSPLSSSDIPTVLCSEETFVKLTGIDEYAVIDIQVTKKAEKDIDQKIRKLLESDKVYCEPINHKRVIFLDPWKLPYMSDGMQKETELEDDCMDVWNNH